MRIKKTPLDKKRERMDRYIRQKRHKKLADCLLREDNESGFFEEDDRLRIIEALGAIMGQAAVPTLVACYNQRFRATTLVRQQILQTLAALDTPEAVAFIAKQMLEESFDEAFGKTLYRQLMESGNKECLMPVSRMLIAPAEDRRTIAELLHNKANRYNKIILGDEKDYERYAKSHGLEFVKHAQARYDLQDDADQLRIIQALGNMHKFDAVALLIQLLEKYPDQNDPFRLRIIKALSFSKIRPALDCLYAELEKSESYVLRVEIIKAIKMFGTRLSVKRLEKCFISPPDVRKLLRDTINYLGDSRYMKIIAGDRGDFERLLMHDEALFSPLIKDEKHRLRKRLGTAAAAVAEAGLLYELGEEDGYTYLIDALGNGKGEVRKRSAVLLSQLGHPEYPAVFLGEDEDDFSRLGRLDYEQHKTDIMRIFNHCSQDNRKRIVKAFREYQGHPVNDILEQKHRVVFHSDHNSHEDTAPEHIDAGYTEEEYNSGYRIYNYSPHSDCYSEHQDTASHQDSPHRDTYRDLDLPGQESK